MTQSDPDSETTRRRRWMGLLARSAPGALERAWLGLASRPGYTVLRPAQTGLALVRARMGGDGAPFNLGEMTMTRCAVRLAGPAQEGSPDSAGGDAGGILGLGYVAGRDARKAELAAVFDALLQHPALGPGLLEAVVAPLAAAEADRRARAARATAPTRVEFFTLVRGEDAR
jgi:alpha-D-ribose 1-methylphosphonate 5-triphosphate synthase subunit PhnG